VNVPMIRSTGTGESLLLQDPFAYESDVVNYLSNMRQIRTVLNSGKMPIFWARLVRLHITPPGTLE